MPTIMSDEIKCQQRPSVEPAHEARGTMNAPAQKAVPHEQGVPPRLAYTVKETAQMLGISEKSVRRLIDRGLLRTSKALRHLLIPRSEIERFLRDTL
jgi:excisionase family DNA binding protein